MSSVESKSTNQDKPKRTLNPVIKAMNDYRNNVIGVHIGSKAPKKTAPIFKITLAAARSEMGIDESAKNSIDVVDKASELFSANPDKFVKLAAENELSESSNKASTKETNKSKSKKVKEESNEVVEKKTKSKKKEAKDVDDVVVEKKTKAKSKKSKDDDDVVEKKTKTKSKKSKDVVEDEDDVEDDDDVVVEKKTKTKKEVAKKESPKKKIFTATVKPTNVVESESESESDFDSDSNSDSDIDI